MSLKCRSMALICLICAVCACAEDAEDDLQSNPDESAATAETRSSALTDEERGYSILTPEQLERVERQPWEEPGMEDLKPPQEVLDARFGDRATFVPNPKGVAHLARLEQRWETRRIHLEQVENLSEDELDARYLKFKDNFLREQIVAGQAD
jgi:hypothetical protein